jgi:hypothetical protein
MRSSEGVVKDCAPQKNRFPHANQRGFVYGDIMKRFIILALGVILLVSGVAYGGYSVGYEKGFNRALILQNGTFVGSLEVLEKLRAGDTANGINRLERLCFSAANTVHEKRTQDSQFVAKTFADPLRNYRNKYRANKAEWTPSEQNLEAKLATLK